MYFRYTKTPVYIKTVQDISSYTFVRGKQIKATKSFKTCLTKRERERGGEGCGGGGGGGDDTERKKAGAC